MPAAPVTQAEMVRASKVATATGSPVEIVVAGKVYRILPAQQIPAHPVSIEDGEATCDEAFGVAR